MSGAKPWLCKWLFCVFILLQGFNSKAQLSANFSSNTTSGCSPLVVRFSNISTGNPTKFKWDLGNGTKSLLKDPAVTYFAPGQYTIKLVISNTSGTDSIIRTNYITVYSTPIVEFGSTTKSGCYPLPVQFADSGLAGSGEISKWEWDFGDGEISSEKNPHHIYRDGGSYNVSLRLTNSFGCIKSITKPDYINITNGVRAAFSNTVPNSCKPPVTINFTNESTGSGVLSYVWDFGDGNTSTQTDPSHTYLQGGSYTVGLIIKNNNGCTDTLIKPNAITLGTINADFNIPGKVCAGVALAITNTSVPVPGSVTWFFGDGTMSSSNSPSKTYTAAGNYTIKMVANFGACLDSTEKSIEVLEKPVSDFSADQTSDCKAPLIVKFKNESINGVSYLWGFGDGSTSTEKEPEHIYTRAGDYTVTLATTNATGCSDITTKAAFIKITPPQAGILDLPVKACAPLVNTFKSDVSANEAVASYEWDFGDGQKSTEAEPEHTFINPGSYTITLIVKTISGCADTTIFTDGIVAGIKPRAAFSALQNEVCANTPIVFRDTSTGTVDKWSWDFGDGVTSAEKDPSHYYEDTGRFDVTLIVENNGCADTLVKKDFVHIKGPIAKYETGYKCNDPLTRTFTNRSIAAETFSWDFGDGKSSTDSCPVHVYASPGSYTVKLDVYNSTTGCTSTTTQTVAVITENANYTATDTVICKGSLITFNTAGINGGNISSFAWNFGDGTKMNAGSSVEYYYKKSGTYTVTLIVTDLLGCKDTMVRSNYIRVDGPTANFKSSVSGTCLNNDISFIDNSISDGIHPIMTWDFNFGDGTYNTYTAPPFVHSYTQAGKYNLVLKVTDSKGCTDSMQLSKSLIISQPAAKFSAQDSLSCPGKPITFINHSTGPAPEYMWTFGDGNTSTLANPVHTYTDGGLYTVTLSVKDKYGCTAILSKTDFINIITPNADFLMSDSVTNCPPLVVNFTNTSANYTSVSWDFGDGNTSNVEKPSHFYSLAGNYTVKLKITTPGGCTDVKSKTIVVNGPEGTLTYTNALGCSPLQVSFKATAKNNASFIWDFNDGNTIDTKDSVLKHVYDEPGLYLPKIILLDENGCKVPIVGKDTITVFGIQADFNFTNILLCDSGSIQFSDKSLSNDLITSYLWKFGDGNTSAAQNPSHKYAKSGAFITSLIVTTQAGCKDTVTTPSDIKIINSPKIAIESSEGACVPATFSFAGKITTPDTSALQWKWNFDNGKVSNVQNPDAQLYSTANNYNVKLTAVNSSGCSTTVTKIASAYPLPAVKANDDLFLCKGQSISLSATGAKSYSWSSDPTLSCLDCVNPIAKPLNDVQYKVTGKSEFGCIASDSLQVTVKQPFQMQVSQNDSICNGAIVQLSASGTDKFSWSPSASLSNAQIANPVATPSSNTLYTVIGTDDRGCFKDTAFVAIKVNPVPTVSAGEDKTINVGQTIELDPILSADVNKVIWIPTAGIFRHNYPAITAKPNETQEYTVEVSNQGGCKARDRVTVYVLCNNANVFVPNTFSPNSDGMNDIFYPRGNGVFQVKMLRVFNRWGDVVFEKSNVAANDITSGWDGTFKGQKLPADVFVYTLTVVCDNNTLLTYKGNIALVR